MVAKINIGSSLFGALSYNQEKVEQGEGKILFSNRIIQNTDGSHNMYFNMKSFEPYLDANKRTEKPILHISLNPHPDDKLTNEQLSDIAQEYMDKMGYGNQPYLVYKHEDLDRHHLHIVSVRVDETGKKLDDSFEKRRSEKVRKELEEKYKLIPAELQSNRRSQIQQQSNILPMKPLYIKEGNIKKQISNITKTLIKDYCFQSVNEFRALLNIYGLTVEEVKGELRGKAYNGLVYSALNKKGEKMGNPFKASLIGRDVGYNALQKKIDSSKVALKDKKIYNRAKNIISNLLKENPSRKQFEKELTKNGISVLFRTNEDKRIYGVTFIDHQEKAVFNGSRMGKEFSANVFHNLFSCNKNDNHFEKEDWKKDFTSNYSHEQDSNNSIGLFAMEQHGDNYEEIAFTNRMKRKKRKLRGPKL